jgi:hypothetical protein
VTRQLVFMVGGPAYTGQVLTEHCAHVSNIVAEFHRNNFDCRVQYCKSTLVGRARADILCAALDSGVDVLLTIDSDTWGPFGLDPIFQSAFSLVGVSSLMPAELETANQYWPKSEIEAVPKTLIDRLAIVSLVVACRDRSLNFWTNGRPGVIDDFQRPVIQVDAVGLAYSFFNLAWYRRHRTIARMFDCYVDGHSEDVNHCEAVRTAGGIIFAGLSKTYHKPCGTEEVLALSPEYVTP